MHFLGVLLFAIALSLHPDRSALQVYRSECLHAGFDSYVAVMDNCIGYLHCVGDKSFAYECPLGTHFDEQHQICALDGPLFVCHRPNKMQHEDTEEYVEEVDSGQQSEGQQEVANEAEGQQEVIEEAEGEQEAVEEEENQQEAVEEEENQQEVFEGEAENQQEAFEGEAEDQQEALAGEAEDQREVIEVEEEAEDQQESINEVEDQPEVVEKQTEGELKKPPTADKTQQNLGQVPEAAPSTTNQTGGQAVTLETPAHIHNIPENGSEVPPNAYYNIRPLSCHRSAVTYHAYPLNCGYYYRCWHGYLEVMSCSLAYGWDHQLERCLPLDQAQCYGQ